MVGGLTLHQEIEVRVLFTQLTWLRSSVGQSAPLIRERSVVQTHPQLLGRCFVEFSKQLGLKRSEVDVRALNNPIAWQKLLLTFISPNVKEIRG